MRSDYYNTVEADQCLQKRILQFKADEDKMIEINRFIDEVLLDANIQVQQHQTEKLEDSEKNGTNILGLKHRKIVARARGFCLRLFETISNCAASTTISHLPIRKS